MFYSSAGLLGLIVNLIINSDILLNRAGDRYDPTRRNYRRFLIAMNAYFITDILWGIFYANHLIALTFLDTVVYFITMGCSILFWTLYVVRYLRENSWFGKTLLAAGWIIFGFQLAALILNFFTPCFFLFDSQGVYQAQYARYIALAFQILMYLLTAVYAFTAAFRSNGSRRLRYTAIGSSSLSMGLFIVLQVIYPLLPIYSVGCMLVACVLHRFVMENEREEYRETLEERLQDSILKGNYYDHLTGMPGMSYFFELAGKQRELILNSGEKPAFLFFDLSGLKFYNQKNGFAEGDRILRAFSQLLLRFYGENRCTRFGSDHFAVLTEEAGLEDKLHEIFRIWAERGDDKTPAIRVGIYLDDDINVDISTACDRAKSARDVIRSSYVSSFRYFDAPMLENAERSQYIISHLDKAIEDGWIEVYYQPIIRSINGRVCDEEALARWNDPERGRLSPAEFIPILENARLIYKLDLHMLDLIIEKIKRLEAAGLFLVPQSINLSRTDFDCCDIVEEIQTRMDAAGIPHHLLSVEITESIIGTDFDFIKTQLERFRTLGFPVWMDDFGSGYSSLDVLADMPVDLIKLDIRFIQKFRENDQSKIILTELMKMATAMGIDTVCEGVEEKEQAEFLRDIGCSKLQGYYFTKPMPLSEILHRYETGIQIGFENPAESDYYDAISRINLYDIGILIQNDANALHQFFRTIPMGIIELRGNKVRFTRSNQAYQDFVSRSIGAEMHKNSDVFDDLIDAPDSPFTRTLNRIASEGGYAFLDETRPDGSVIHSFIRYISHDALTDTTALLTAVLSLTPPNSDTPQSPLDSEEPTIQNH